MNSKIACAFPVILTFLGCQGNLEGTQSETNINPPLISRPFEHEETMREIGKRLFKLSDEENTAERVWSEIIHQACGAHMEVCLFKIETENNVEKIINCINNERQECETILQESKSEERGGSHRGGIGKASDWEF